MSAWRGSQAMGYMPQLDGLRCLAVGAVMLAHFGGQEMVRGTYLAQIQWGGLGVHAFLLLSGYLITTILLQARDGAEAAGQRPLMTARQFYLRRALRIFPAYYFMIGVGLVLGLEGVVNFLGWHLTYTTNVARAVTLDNMPPVGHFWTLAVEEQFYLFWPWVVLLLPRRALLPAILAMIATALGFRFILRGLEFHHYAYAHLTPACLDFLGLGALLAWSQMHPGRHARALAWLGRAGLIVGLPVMLVRPLSYFEIEPWAKTLEPFCGGLFYFWMVHHARAGFGGFGGWLLGARPVVYLGRISYGIYLYHLPVYWVMLRGAERLGVNLTDTLGTVPTMMLAMAASIAAAMVSWHLLEEPINRLKRHVPYVRRGRKGASAPWPKPPWLKARPRLRPMLAPVRAPVRRVQDVGRRLWRARWRRPRRT